MLENRYSYITHVRMRLLGMGYEDTSILWRGCGAVQDDESSPGTDVFVWVHKVAESCIYKNYFMLKTYIFNNPFIF